MNLPPACLAFVPVHVHSSSCFFGAHVCCVCLSLGFRRLEPEKQVSDPALKTAANAAAGDTVMSGGVARASKNSDRCCRCGELFESGYYTRNGWVQGPRPSRGADSDSPCVSDDPYNDDDYTPGRRRAQKQSPKSRRKATGCAVAKPTQRQKQQHNQQQVGQLHGVGHRGAKRHRLSSGGWAADSLQQQKDQGDNIGKPISNRKRIMAPTPAVRYENSNEQQQVLKDAFAEGPKGMIAAPNVSPGAADAALEPSGSSSGLVCSACLREMALQEVQEACGTTLIVVPSTILVQVGNILAKIIGRVVVVLP